MKKITSLSIAVALFAVNAHAVQNYSASNVSNLAQDDVTSLIKTVAIGADHHAYQSATSMGMLLGVDIGIELTGIALPQNFKNALASAATGGDTSNLPSIVPMPKLNLHKGLPFGIDIGLSYGAASDNGSQVYKSIGFDVKYSILDSMLLPALAVRASASYNDLFFMTTHTYSFDVVASKNLLVIDPYVGFGFQSWTGSINYPVSAQGLSANVSANASGTTPRFYVGIPLKLLLLHLTGEYSYSFASVSTYGLKLSAAF